MSSFPTVCDPLEALPDHEPWLRTALLARMGNRDEVEEVLQEVAVAAASQSAKSEPVERAGPWLYRVAIRQMLLFRRKAGRRRKLLHRVTDRPLHRDDSSPRDPLEFLISQERQKEVREALVKMSERDRQLLMLKYVDGLSYGEIAEHVGVTASAVQSRLHRARGILRKHLSQKIMNDRDDSTEE
jgi:RNA polymerase sigma factor (sigma-70 family)